MAGKDRENVHIKLRYQPRSHGPYHYRQSQKQSKDHKPEVEGKLNMSTKVLMIINVQQPYYKWRSVSIEPYDNPNNDIYVLVNGRHVNGVVGNTDKTGEDHRCNPVDVGGTEGSPSKAEETNCLKGCDLKSYISIRAPNGT